MRNRFAKTCIALSAGVAVATTVGLSPAGAAGTPVRAAGTVGAAGTPVSKVRPDATPACGGNCFNNFSLLLGTRTIMNAYVPGDTGGGGKAGQPVVLQRAGDTHPNQDFADNGKDFRVRTSCGTGSGDLFAPTSYVCRNLGSSFAFEEDWAPYGIDSGLCIGIAAGAGSGAKLTLQPCGAARTLFIEDRAHSVTRGGNFYTPLIVGASSSFSRPLVLTVDEGSTHPANQLVLQPENVLTGGAVESAQQFSYRYGAVS